jgi:hypothetical protein
VIDVMDEAGRTYLRISQSCIFNMVLNKVNQFMHREYENYLDV